MIGLDYCSNFCHSNYPNTLQTMLATLVVFAVVVFPGLCQVYVNNFAILPIILFHHRHIDQLVVVPVLLQMYSHSNYLNMMILFQMLIMLIVLQWELRLLTHTCSLLRWKLLPVDLTEGLGRYLAKSEGNLLETR
jgi:hypothetical protein